LYSASSRELLRGAIDNQNLASRYLSTGLPLKTENTAFSQILSLAITTLNIIHLRRLTVCLPDSLDFDPLTINNNINNNNNVDIVRTMLISRIDFDFLHLYSNSSVVYRLSVLAYCDVSM